MPDNGYKPVFQLTRGGIVESVHFGAAVAVRADGRLMGSVGDQNLVTFLRSSAKPFQALPFVESGGPDYFEFTLKEIALTCASHAGTDDHVKTAQSMQDKAGFDESHLQCGTHPPIHAETRLRMQKIGEEVTSNRHNCSGKHSGMLSYSQMMGWPLENYLDTEHPLQLEILHSLSAMSSLEIDQITIGIDGCSAPNFAMPLYNAALAYARLADPEDLPESRADSCRRITEAMFSHPDMIAGPGEFDTELMTAGGGRLVAKGGAEGYQAVGLLPGALGEDSPGVGIAVKISDGGYRHLASHAVTLEILRQIGLDMPWESLQTFGPTVALENYRKIEVGTASPCFELSA